MLLDFLAERCPAGGAGRAGAPEAPATVDPSAGRRVGAGGLASTPL